MDNILKRLLGLILLPFLYARYTFVFFLPLLFTKWGFGMFVFCWVVFASFYSVLKIMVPVSKLIVWYFDIKYKEIGQWCRPMMHSASVWSHPIVRINDRAYHFSYTTMGGTMYEGEEKLRRLAVHTWLFSI